jgi:uncharacterized membrane protein
VNHHACFAQVNRSSVSFVWANGFLLLTIVLIPFPTALLGAYLFTDHAAPAVVIYNAVAAVQAVGWILVCGAALGDGLTRSSTSAAMMRDSRRNAFVGWALYSLLALLGFWFPRVSAMVTAMSWAFWLIFGIRRFGVRSE